MTTMKDGQEAEAEATFNTSMLEDLIGEFVARQAGIEMPVVHDFQWLWSPAKQGPVCLVKVRRVANVVPLRRKKT